jgi:hypothetical protein
MLAMVHAFLHDDNAVLDLLEQSLEIGEAWLCCMPVEARFETVFKHDRFNAILDAINHPLREHSEIEQTAAFIDKTTVLLDPDND